MTNPLLSILRRLGRACCPSKGREGEPKSPDRVALERLAAMSDLARVHAIEHYLYLADEPTARQVAAVLREKGFAIEDRIGAYGDDWLVLAQSRALPTEEHIAQARALFEQIASEHGGYYDGWDAEVEPQASCESHEREIGPQASRESSEPEE